MHIAYKSLLRAIVVLVSLCAFSLEAYAATTCSYYSVPVTGAHSPPFGVRHGWFKNGVWLGDYPDYTLWVNGTLIGSGLTPSQANAGITYNGNVYTLGALQESAYKYTCGGNAKNGWDYCDGFGYQACETPLNSPPTVYNRSMVVNEDTAGVMVATASDPDAGDYHSYQIVGGPAYGSAYFSGATLIYYPPANWYGTTYISYQATDSQSAASNVATVTVTVSPVNDAPVVADAGLVVTEDTVGYLALSASDIDSPAPTVFQVASGPSVGTAYVSGTTLVYIPPSEWSGTTTLTYMAQDSAGAWSSPATVYITVNPVNDPPVAAPKTLTINEDSSGSVTLTATDVDSPVPTVFQIVTPPNAAHGTAWISGSTLTFAAEDNWYGSTSLTYRAQDTSGAWSAPTTVTITVNPVNDAPVAQAKTLTTNEDIAGTVTLTATDIDSPAPTVFQIVTAPNAAYGIATIAGSTLTFTPEDNWSGSTSLTYRAQDSSGAWSAAVTVSITVNPVNDAPVAQAKALTVAEDTAGTVTLSATDVDSPVPTVFQIVTAPNAAHGTASISGATLTFTPEDNWNGSTSLTYRAQDSGGAWSAPVTVTITVTPVNDAPVAQAKSLTTSEDTPASVTLTATDVDSPAPSVFQIVTAPNAAHGTASIAGSTLTFTPEDNWSGTSSLTYRAQDSSGAWSAAVTVSITVTPVNDPPVAQAKALTVAEDTAGTVTLSATDVDSPVPTVFQIVTAPNVAHGTASITGATLTFTPEDNWNGSTSLTYRAQDSGGVWSAPVTVAITVTPVNDAPMAQTKALTTAEDTAGTVTLSATDVDSPAPTVFQIVTAPNVAHGTASISGSTLTFTPEDNWNGTSSLTYRAQDSSGAWSAAVTVSITVTPVNDIPVAQAKSLTTAEDTPGTVALTATDIDSPTPTAFAIVTAPNPAHGTASITGSTLTFTPANDWNGASTLTYRAQDSGGAWSAPVSVAITVTPVNDAPVAQAKALTTNEDTAGTVALSATDVDSPTPTTFAIVTPPNAAHGTASISGSTLTFTPEDDWNGATTLTYRAQDTAGAWSAPVTVSITVTAVNDVPLAQAKTLTTNEDTSGTVTLSATDIDSPVPTVFQIVSAPNATHGAASISGSTLTFTPAANWNGTSSLTYRAQDSSGAWSAAVTVSITVNPVNDIPVAQAKSLTVNEDTSGTVTLSATDIDSPVPTVFQIVTAPNATHGTASISGSTLTFTPAANWNGTSSLTYRAQDSAGAWSAPVTVSITVNAVNDPPVVQAKTLTTNEDTSGTVALTATDVDSSVFTYEVVSQPNNGNASISGSTLTFTPAKDWFGTTTLTYRAKDDAGDWSSAATITITVNPVNDIPVVQNLTLAVDEDTPGSLTLVATDIDSAANFVFQIVSPLPAAAGTATVQGDKLSLNPAANWHGSTSLTYRAQDPEGAWSAPATVSITVRPVNDTPVEAAVLEIHTQESRSATVTATVAK